MYFYGHFHTKLQNFPKWSSKTSTVPLDRTCFCVFVVILLKWCFAKKKKNRASKLNVQKNRPSRNPRFCSYSCFHQTNNFDTKRTQIIHKDVFIENKNIQNCNSVRFNIFPLSHLFSLILLIILYLHSVLLKLFIFLSHPVYFAIKNAAVTPS